MMSMQRGSRVALLAGMAALVAGAAARGQHTATGAALPAPVAAHEAAARELVQLFDLKKAALNNGMAAFDAQTRVDPKAARYADVMRAWLTKVFQEIDLEGAVVQLYEETFSEEEMRDIITFYRTPTGQKVLTKCPELLQKGMAIGMEKVQAHLGELKEMIARRDKDLAEQSGASQTPAAGTPPSPRP